MKITRFMTTADGGSQFDEIEVPFDEEIQGASGYTLMASNPYDSTDVRFVELPADLNQDWHPPPTLQMVVVLSGIVEVTTTDNARRHWGKGDVFVAADLDGRGHRTRTIDGPAIVMFAPFPENFAMETWSVTP